MGMLEFMETLQLGQVCPLTHGHPGQSIIYHIDRGLLKIKCQGVGSNSSVCIHGPHSLTQFAEHYRVEPKFNEWGEVCL